MFNRVSGTTGLTGSADATFVLEKEHRASDTAALYAIGRDIEYQEFTLRFRDCSWELVERKSQEQLAAAEVPPILFRLVAFMEGRREWSGTATELLSEMGETDTAPNVITKLLNEYHATVLRQNNVRYVYSSSARQGVVCYTLETQPEKSEIFSAAGVALSEPWREESPAPASCVSGVFSRQVDSGGGIPK